MSFKDKVFEVIDQDIEWHKENTYPLKETYSDDEIKLIQEYFIKGMHQAKYWINQVWEEETY